MKTQDVVIGRILLEIKKGQNYFRALELSGIPPSTLSRYIPLMERDGLILVDVDPQTRRRILKLNESRMDEINKLINAYLESEKKEFKEKIEFVVHYIDFTEEEKKEIIEKLKRRFGV